MSGKFDRAVPSRKRQLFTKLRSQKVAIPAARSWVRVAAWLESLWKVSTKRIAITPERRVSIRSSRRSIFEPKRESDTHILSEALRGLVLDSPPKVGLRSYSQCLWRRLLRISVATASECGRLCRDDGGAPATRSPPEGAHVGYAQQALTLHEALQHLAAGMERLRAEIPTPGLERIKGHVDGWRGKRVAGPVPEPLESGDELLIEHRHLAVEDQRGLRQGGNRRRQVTEATGVIAAIATEELHLAIGFVRQNPPAVVLLLVDPALPGARDGVACISAMSEGRVTFPVYRGRIAELRVGRGHPMVDRRTFLGTLSIGLLAAPLAAEAQPTKVPKIGVLLYNSPQTEPLGPLLEGLRVLGYVDGKTMAIEYRFAEGRAERLPELASELVLLKPDVIFAYGGDVALHMKKATGSIPIVAMASNDPVQSGLVASLARPGANATGITLVYDALAGKVLELLKEAVPGIARVAVLWNPDHADPEFRETQRAATALGVRVQSLEVRRSGDFDGAFKAALSEHAEGLIIVSGRLLIQQRRQIAEFRAKNRIAMAGGWGDWTRDGFLLTYGPNTVEAMRRIPVYIDKILKGAKPANLPVEQPTKFELVINLKTAKALGLTIPPSLLLRADQVIACPEKGRCD